MTPGLYVVGTPIGNMEDISFRAIATLRAARLILAEDTRHTRKLLTRHEIHVPLMSYHKFNEAAREESVVRSILEEQAAIALVTNAGMPAVSDPGARLVRACLDRGIAVSIVPGPSAVTSALALSGCDGSGFHFAGFLPHKAGARRRLLAELCGLTVPVVLFESPYRLVRLLEDLEAIAPDREVVVAREMTKRFEQTSCGTAAALLNEFRQRTVKGECTVVVAPAESARRNAVRGEAIDTTVERC